MTVPKNIFLLRRGQSGRDSLILKQSDLPLRFTFSGKYYVVELTRSGKLIMKAEEVA